MKNRTTIIIVYIFTLMSCSKKASYFEEINCKDFLLNQNIEKIEIKEPYQKEVLNSDIVGYRFSDSINLNKKKYKINYFLIFKNEKLSKYRFLIENVTLDEYYIFAKKLAKKRRFDIDTNKIKPRYYLKNNDGNLYFNYSPNLDINIGDINGGRE